MVNMMLKLEENVMAHITTDKIHGPHEESKAMDPTCELYMRNEVSTNLRHTLSFNTAPWASMIIECWVLHDMLPPIDGNSIDLGKQNKSIRAWSRSLSLIEGTATLSWVIKLAQRIQKVWRKLEKIPITINNVYQSKAGKWNCTCTCVQHLPSANSLSASTLFSVCNVFPSFSSSKLAVFANHPSGDTRAYSPRRIIVSSKQPELQNPILEVMMRTLILEAA